MKTPVPIKVNDFFKIYEEKNIGFEIPSYQRGYRWQEDEIKKLLNDINEIKDTGYCLQPIILKGNKIVDGQQRLTTLALLYDEIRKVDKIDEEKKQTEYYESLVSIGRNNIDKHHIKKAQEIIHDELKNTEDISKKIDNCFFILCELDDDENELEVFERLNTGRIPLSSAEILKAYYLTESKFVFYHQEFLQKWNMMEKCLQNDDFYFFFSHDESPCNRYLASRMDFLLEAYAVAEKELSPINMDAEYESNPIFLFNFLKEKEESPEDFIAGLYKQFLSLCKIYDSMDLYNLYGYLSCYPAEPADNKHMLKLIQSCHGLHENSNPAAVLKNNIKEKYNALYGIKPGQKLYLDSIRMLEYGKNNKEIECTLLLHNTLKSIQVGDRFEFNRYRNEANGFNLEHIHARAEMKSGKTLEKYYKQVEEQFSSDSNLKYFLAAFSRYCNENKEKKDVPTDFEQWEDCIWALEAGKKIVRNGDSWIPENYEDASWRYVSIKNLCLLSTRVNSAISNNLYQVKRKLVTDFFYQGEMIPIASKEIFIDNEPYNGPDIFIWNSQMGEKYLNDIIKTIKEVINV